MISRKSSIENFQSIIKGRFGFDPEIVKFSDISDSCGITNGPPECHFGGERYDEFSFWCQGFFAAHNAIYAQEIKHDRDIRKDNELFDALTQLVECVGKETATGCKNDVICYAREAIANYLEKH